MNKITTIITAILAIIICSSVFGANITIWDEDGYMGYGQGGEDQETEPGMINNQNWDLEGFFLNNNILSVIGGFNFRDGYTYSRTLFTAGDIFLDINGDAQFGTGAYRRQLEPTRLNYGYDYAIKVNWKALSYNVYKLNSSSTLLDVSESENIPESNPFALVVKNESMLVNGTLTLSALNDAQSGFKGGKHYLISGFNLSFLSPGTEFISHLTLSCGNDNLMGRGKIISVSEPGTMGLLLLGLFSLCGLARPRKKTQL